jgi:hypothetical protein
MRGSRRRKYPYRGRNLLIKHNNQQEAGNSINWADTGLLIGVLTALGYFVAYSYQKGYLSFFGITEVFLSQITIVNVIISISVVGTALFLGITAYDGFIKVIPESNNPFWQVLKKSFLPYLFWALITAPLTIVYLKIVLYVLAGILVLLYIIPIFTHWNVKGYMNKLRKQVEHEDKTRLTRESILTAWNTYPSSRLFILIAVFLLLPHLSSLFGYKIAETSEHFFIFDNQQGEKFVVIDKIGDNFLVAPIDLSKKEITKHYQLIEQKSELDKPILFEKVKINGGITAKQERKY